MDIVSKVKGNTRVFLNLDVKYSFLSHGSYNVPMSRTSFCLTDWKVGVPASPLFLSKCSFPKQCLITIDDGQALFYDTVHLSENILTPLHKSSSCWLWHVFFLSHLLSFKLVLDVKSSQGGNSDSLIGVDTVEKFCSFLKRVASPLFECLWAEEKVNMFLIKNARFLLESYNFLRLKSFSAEILNLVDSEVERLWNHFVWEELAWLFGRLFSFEPKKKCSLSELFLEMFRHFSILHFYLIEIFRGKYITFSWTEFQLHTILFTHFMNVFGA